MAVYWPQMGPTQLFGYNYKLFLWGHFYQKMFELIGVLTFRLRMFLTETACLHR